MKSSLDLAPTLLATVYIRSKLSIVIMPPYPAVDVFQARMCCVYRVIRMLTVMYLSPCLVTVAKHSNTVTLSYHLHCASSVSSSCFKSGLSQHLAMGEMAMLASWVRGPDSIRG